MKKLIVLASVLICVVALHVPLRVEDELEDLKEAVSKRHSNRQKIEEERRKSEEKRRKAEEERRKEEEERLRKEKERQEAERRKQEEKRRKQEEERRKVEEKRVKAEEKRKKHEEERLRKEKERRQRLEKERQKQEKERQKQRQEKLRKEQEKQRERERQQEERRRKEEERRQKEEEKRRNEEEKRKEQWEREYQRLINKHGKDEEFWKLKKDKKEEHYTPKLKKKLEKGEKITAEEDVEFQNEYGPYKSRNTTAVIDLITAINNVNDIESDIVRNAPDFDLRNTHLNTDFCKQKQNKKKAICKNKKYRGNSKRSMITNEEGWERKKRDGMRNRVYLWLDRTVPYEIDSPLEISRETIESSLKRIEELTCVRFVKHTQSDTNWIKFVSKTGCWSSVGREFWSESFQEISLGTNCVYKGIIMHEVLHALGFYHEQSRPDRDQYVEIFWENIQSAQQHNFMKYKLKESDTLGAPYDYSSIMHYGKYSFALDANKPTIQSVRNNLEPLGQRSDLTPTDIFQVNEMYNCANTGTGWSDWSTYGPCDLNCMKSRNRFCMDPKDKTNCPNPTSTTMLRWGIDTERVKCSDAECYAPVNGHWNRWASWSDCSVTCDEGTHTRTRECTDPAPANGGDQCVGERIESRTCISRSCTAGPYDCTFDIDSEPTCSWKQDDTDDFDWIKNSGSTSSSSTGPSGDHTSGTGFYVYMESSSPARPGWKTRLLSPTMSSGDRCMKFAYNMYGFFTGSLRVMVKDIETKQSNTVFEESGDKLKDWHIAEIDIGAGSNEYTIAIEAERADGFQGDIAIDDIEVKEHACGSSVNETVPKTPTVETVGCYRDVGYIDGKRPFFEFKDFRGEINWKDHINSLNETVIKCAAYAREHFYEYFSVEYYGECWTGPTSEINYGRDGEAGDCYPGPSQNLGPFLVGAEFSMMVYRWINIQPEV